MPFLEALTGVGPKVISFLIQPGTSSASLKGAEIHRASRPARFLSAESGESEACDSPLSALRNRAGRDARDWRASKNIMASCDGVVSSTQYYKSVVVLAVLE